MSSFSELKKETEKCRSSLVKSGNKLYDKFQQQVLTKNSSIEIREFENNFVNQSLIIKEELLDFQ